MGPQSRSTYCQPYGTEGQDRAQTLSRGHLDQHWAPAGSHSHGATGSTQEHPATSAGRQLMSPKAPTDIISISLTPDTVLGVLFSLHR